MSELKLIKARVSTRAFSPREIENEKIQNLFEAARWSASAYNEQPWHFYCVTQKNPDKFNNAIACLVEFNQLWAKNAFMIVIATAKKVFEHNGKINMHSWYDLGQSVANMAIEATAQGLFVHQMSGFSADKAGRLIAVQPDYEPVTMIAIGYKGEVSDLPDDISIMESTPRHRKALEQIVFTDN